MVYFEIFFNFLIHRFLKVLFVYLIMMMFDIIYLYKRRNPVSEIQHSLQCECNVHSGFKTIVTTAMYKDMWDSDNISSVCY